MGFVKKHILHLNYETTMGWLHLILDIAISSLQKIIILLKHNIFAFRHFEKGVLNRSTPHIGLHKNLKTLKTPNI